MIPECLFCFTVAEWCLPSSCQTCTCWQFYNVTLETLVCTSRAPHIYHIGEKRLLYPGSIPSQWLEGATLTQTLFLAQILILDGTSFSVQKPREVSVIIMCCSLQYELTFLNMQYLDKSLLADETVLI
jgi:hypothetical protein